MKAMKSQIHIASAIFLLAITSTPIAAQTVPSEEVTVFAPYVVKKESGPRNAQIITVSRKVNYHDLDLSKPADVSTLEQRVKQSAEDVCKELDRQYTSGDWTRIKEERFCARDVYATGLAEVRMLAAAAREK
jgi:UrcA family protein